MGYKLPVEKKHRLTKGGTRPRQIAKGEAHGRTLSTRYDPAYKSDTPTTSGRKRANPVGAIITRHATKGIRVRSTRSMGWGA